MTDQEQPGVDVDLANEAHRDVIGRNRAYQDASDRLEEQAAGQDVAIGKVNATLSGMWEVIRFLRRMVFLKLFLILVVAAVTAGLVIAVTALDNAVDRSSENIDDLRTEVNRVGDITGTAAEDARQTRRALERALTEVSSSSEFRDEVRVALERIGRVCQELTGSPDC